MCTCFIELGVTANPDSETIALVAHGLVNPDNKPHGQGETMPPELSRLTGKPHELEKLEDSKLGLPRKYMFDQTKCHSKATLSAWLKDQFIHVDTFVENNFVPNPIALHIKLRIGAEMNEMAEKLNPYFLLVSSGVHVFNCSIVHNVRVFRVYIRKVKIKSLVSAPKLKFKLRSQSLKSSFGGGN